MPGHGRRFTPLFQTGSKPRQGGRGDVEQMQAAHATIEQTIGQERRSTSHFDHDVVSPDADVIQERERGLRIRIRRPRSRSWMTSASGETTS